jgi:NADPH:quinone reductase-like Zn-dependent oxidoreductase
MPPASCMRSRGGHRRWGTSSGFYAEYVAVSAEGVAHLPMGLDEALELELQRGQAVGHS